MVDISNKPKVFREAIASGNIELKAKTVDLIKKGKIAKGDPIPAAKIAGILAAKKTSDLIPFCHPLPLTKIEINIKILDEKTLQTTSTVQTIGQTGVEMEALVATTTSLLTIWDMVKQYEKDLDGQYPSTLIKDIFIVKKIKR